MWPVRKTLFSCIIASIAASSILFSAAHASEIGQVSCLTQAPSQYAPVEISAEIPGGGEEAFDPSVMDVSASITTPSGKNIVVNSFYPGKGSAWLTRFTPLESGKYSYRISVKSGENTSSSSSYDIEVAKGAGDGFLRRSPKNPYYLVFDSGRTFFGLGHNIAWAPDDKPYFFERYFAQFRDTGCNLARIWMNVPWGFPFEWEKAGKYNMRIAEKIDAVIKLAEGHGVYVVLALDSYSNLMEEEGSWDEDSWNKNPYNALNGGPCEKPWDFFTNDAAKKLYKNRLRYIMARWGYSPNILAFEFWNELDAPAEWTKEMADYVRSINPHGQLLTTSLGYPWSNNFDESAVWKLDSMDFIDFHLYGDQTGDAIGAIISIGNELTRVFRKGILVGEFGVSAAKNDGNLDPEGKGYALHDSIWAAAMSRSFAGALNWWWEEYVKPKNLYPHYKALRNFMNGADLASSRVEKPRMGPITLYAGENKTVSYSDITVSTKELWGNTSYGEFFITNDGSVSGGVVNAYLHGEFHGKTMRIEPVFHVDYPVDGKFIVKVGLVSQGGRLAAYVDGEKVLEQDFPAGPGEGPWVKSLYRPDYKIYQCLYNTEVEIPVPRGKHTIKLSNTGADWMGIKNIRLTNYTSNLILNGRVVGLGLENETLVWIQNRTSENVADASLTMEDAGDSTYSVEWWDTYEGKVLSTINVKAADGALTLHIPPFSRDIACKIRK